MFVLQNKALSNFNALLLTDRTISSVAKAAMNCSVTDIIC